jgi:threonine/homoserine/homoserine lactone efflux protein
MNEALVLAVGVALSPVPIAVLILILGGTRPRQLGASFALGWIASVTGSMALLIAVVGAAETSDKTPLWISVPEIVLGLAFLVAAVHIWRRRKRRTPLETPPRWLGAIDRLTPARSAALGLVLSAANPKTLGIALAAAIALAEAHVGSSAAVAAALLFGVIGTTGVAVPLAVSVAAPSRSRTALRRCRAWLLAYDAIILTPLGIAIGAKLLFDGLTAV